jgi:flagellar hook-length control protein FliK
LQANALPIQQVNVNHQYNKQAKSKMKNNTDCFDEIMSSNMNVNTNGNEKATKKERNNSENIKDTKDSIDAADRKDMEEPKDIHKTTDLKETENIKDSEEISEETKDSTKTEQEKLILLLKEISVLMFNELKSSLNLSDEEIQDILDSSGLTTTDLFHKDGLTQFYLYSKGTSDIAMLMTNESMAGEFASFMKGMETVRMEFTEQLDDENLIYHLNNLLQEDPSVILKSDLITSELNLLNPLNAISEEEIVDFEQSLYRNSHMSKDKVNFEVEKLEMNHNEPSDSSLSNSNSLFNAFVEELNFAVNNNQGAETDSLPVYNMDDITNQMVEQIKVKLQPDQTSIEIQLTPKHLGKISLSIVSENGVLTANFTTQNEMIKETIQSQMHILKEQLHNQGLKVEDIEVEVAVPQFSLNQDNQSHSDSRQQNQKSKNAEINWSKMEEDVLASEFMEDGSYTSYEDMGLEQQMLPYGNHPHVRQNTVNYIA